ncbi:acetolactate synthase-1/2/3 large subunit [Tistlia consotensis]|uniref:Acetolactate synthase-1/2/3 large subunit n=1 Tax=Tistlia consotensis USBA 355 TaxID=560819 RepID=A0A1Y6BH29_9PROT|nr:acetolactate synthase large subunit [Tistlia consotensis]SMF09603.1 acetolactate synthase-1/2/3 large subunit [Tistlia consotensis USBA 355]SNR34379.1 acetolactate synthase-1/2/3 large subunit [Tistlia consotensis]
MNGADLLCDALLAQGVELCFANPGTSEMHFVAALDRKPKLRCVLGLQEGVVTGAADGYGRMADKPAATLLHTGPGLANGLVNLHNARRGHTPMINVVGDHAAYHLVHDAPLTSDIDTLARPMSKWQRRIAGAGTIAEDAAAAWRAALELRGPATLILPADAAWGEIAAAVPVPVPAPVPPAPAAEALETAAALLTSGRRCGLIMTGRALRADALETAGRIAAATGAELYSQMSNARMERGAGRVPVTRIPYPVDQALALLGHLEVAILVGAADPVAFFAYPGKPSRLLPEACALHRLAAITDDLPGALSSLAEAVGAGRATPLRAQRADPAEGLPDGALTADAVCTLVARRLPENCIVVDESVSSGRVFYKLSASAPPHDYLQLTGGAIGEGIPLATGAAVACPDRKVINLEADGSGLYSAQGLWTQAREGLDVVTVVFANRAYAILQGEMRNVGVNAFGRNAERMLSLDEPPVDWVALARGFGVEAARATTVEEFAKLFEGALSTRGPFLIECLT